MSGGSHRGHRQHVPGPRRVAGGGAHRHIRDTRPWRRWLTLALTVALPAGLLPFVVSVQVAAADPAWTLTEDAPASILYGSAAQVTLTATNPSATDTVYNLSLRDVLPSGVKYIPGSSTLAGNGSTNPLPDPTVIVNKPVAGQTTLIWSNVGDIQASSKQVVGFGLQPNTDSGPHAGVPAILPNSSYTDSATGYVNADARMVPKFDATTGVIVGGSSTSSAAANGTSTITPLRVDKSEPSPEHELPRGVHDHQVIYTIKVTNNDVHATNAVTVTDYLPAGLEFLGCGQVDNTTNATGTNPGQNVEYPGSGRLNVNSAPPGCAAPVSVDTVTVSAGSPPQPGMAGGIYTKVVWAVANLAASGTATLRYYAAVALRENTDTWSGARPTAASGNQSANLDNNNGPETHDGQSLTNYVGAGGSYQGALGGGANPVADYSSTTVEAIDLAVQKSVDDAAFAGGEYRKYTLNYQTSEYRYTTGAVLTDHLPSGECPVDSSTNHATDSGGAECAAAVGKDPSLAYDSVGENGDGSFDITWNLGTLSTNSDSSVSFWALDRSHYSTSAGWTTPTLTGDSLTNTAQVTGTVHGTCVVGTTPDPTCASGSVIYSGESADRTATNDSGAAQSAPQPALAKRVAATTPVSGGVPDCTAVTSWLTDADTPPVYESGDYICFQLEVDFPAGLYARNPVVTDFLPPNADYVSSAVASANTATVNSTSANTASSPQSVSVKLGDTIGSDLYVSPGQRFVYDLAVQVTQPPAAGNAYDLTQNLMKFTALNTAGQGISLRDDVTYLLSQPVLVGLDKSVAAVNGGAPAGNPPVVKDGDTVDYQVALTNTGLVDAVNTTVTDALPAGVTCADLTGTVSDGGTCSGSTISWTGITVPPSTYPATTPGTRDLTYKIIVPADIAAGQLLTNTAGVTHYESPTANSGDPGTVYTPGTNAPAATDTASITLNKPTLVKAAAPVLNATRATIGEPIRYTLTATIPAGVTLHSATLTDPLGTRLSYCDTTTACPAAVSVTDTDGTSFTTSTAGNTITIGFPTNFATGATADTVTVTFYATVADVAANKRTAGAIGNTATLAWNDSLGNPATPVTDTTNTTVVEPNLSITKTDAPGGPYAPGATISYTVKVTNSGPNTSDAHDLVVLDTLPAAELNPTCITTPANWACVADGGAHTITWTLDTGQALASGASATFTYTAQLPNPVVGSSSFLNTVTAATTSLDTTTYPGARTTGTGYSATTTDTPVVGSPSVAKSASPTSVTHGVDTTYTATVTVPADTTLPNFTAIDTLPAGMVFGAYGSTSCTDTIGSCGPDVDIHALGTPSGGGATLAWWLGNLASDTGIRTITLTYTAHPAKSTALGAQLDNSVELYWDDTNGTLPGTIPSAGSFDYHSNPATARVSVVGPVLTLTKAASTSTPAPGAPFSYTLTIKNTGTSPAHDITLTDPLPAGLDRAASSAGTPSVGTAGYDPGTGVLTWTLTDADTGMPLAPNATATLSITTRLADSSGLSSGQSILNTAQITDYYGVPKGTATGNTSRYDTDGPVNAAVPVTATFPAPHVAKSAPGGSSATVGTPFAWKVVITDTSTAPARNTAVSDVLPPYWTYDTGSTTITLGDGSTVTGAPADPTVSGPDTAHQQTLSWPASALGGITSAQHITVAYTATPRQGVTHTNTNAASVTVEDGSGASGNRTGPYDDGPVTAVATIQTADLLIAKTVGGTGTLVAGGSNSYDIVVRNNGPDAAVNPVVHDTAPAGTTIAGGSGAGWACVLNSGGASIDCTHAGSLANAATAPTLSIALTIPSGDTAASISNTATVSSGTNDPDLTDNQDSVTAPLGIVAQLAVAKSHTGAFTAGQNGSYTLTVTDNGPSDSPVPGPITVTDTLPAGETYVSATSADPWSCSHSAGTVTCTLATGLAAGTSSQILLTVAVPAGQPAATLTNDVGVTGPDSTPATDTDPTNVVTSADLAIAKTHDPGDDFTPGTDVHYTVAVHDNGPSDAVAPVVTDTLPGSLTFVSAGGTGWNCGHTGQVVTCTATADLPAGSSAADITLVATLSPSHAGGAVVNTAAVTSTTTDPVTSNNSDTDSSASGSALADLAIVKSHTGHFTAGQDGSYAVTVTNHGPSDAAGPLTVTDTLPSGESYVSASGLGWSCAAAGQTVTCTRPGTLASGDSDSALAVTVHVASGATIGTDALTNTATASSGTPDPNPANDTATDPTTIDSSADITVTKTHTGRFTPGTTGSYTLTVADAGPSDADGAVVVTDVLPAGESFVVGTGPGWSCSAVAQTVTCTRAAGLVAGTDSAITLTVAVDPGYTGTTLVNTATITSTTTAAEPDVDRHGQRHHTLGRPRDRQDPHR